MTNKEIGNEIKKIKECFEKVKPMSREEQFRQDILKYFISKTEPYAIPESVLMEILEYITYSTNNYIYFEFNRYLREQHKRVTSSNARGVKNGGN